MGATGREIADADARPWPVPAVRWIREATAGILIESKPMKSYRKELWFEIPARVGFVNITERVEECLRESGVREGLLLVNAMHITASVFVNDDERGLLGDFQEWL